MFKSGRTKKKAIIEVDIPGWPISILDLSTPGKVIYCNTVHVSESNGVGGTISALTAKILKENNELIGQYIVEGVRFDAFGSCEVSLFIDVTGQWQECYKLTITVTGIDDSGYTFTKAVSFFFPREQMH